jgi:hypothetical protein
MAGEVITFGRESSNPRFEALGFTKRAQALSEAGWYETALAACAESRLIYDQIGDQDGAAWVWVSEGRAYRRVGDSEAAIAALDNALSRFEEVGDTEAVGWCHLQRGLALLNTDLIKAHHSIARGVASLATINDAYSMIELLEGCAQLLLAEGSWERAAIFWGAGQSLRDQTGIVPAHGDQATLRKFLDKAIDIATSPAFELAVERGRALSPRNVLDQFS